MKKTAITLAVLAMVASAQATVITLTITDAGPSTVKLTPSKTDGLVTDTLVVKAFGTTYTLPCGAHRVPPYDPNAPSIGTATWKSSGGGSGGGGGNKQNGSTDSKMQVVITETSTGVYSTYTVDVPFAIGTLNIFHGPTNYTVTYAVAPASGCFVTNNALNVAQNLFWKPQ